MFRRFGVSEIIFVCFSSLGLAACGGGGGGGGGGPVIATSSYERSGSSLSDSTSNSYDSNLDATWVARQEYKNVRYYDYPDGTFAADPESRGAVNPYTLVGVNNAFARGLSGSGKTIAIVDTDFYSTTHHEITDKTSAGNVSTYGSLSYDTYSSSSCRASNGGCFHGMHVAGLAAADYNSNSSTSVNDDTGYTWANGSYPLLNYGMVGVAYNAGLHLSDRTKTSNGSLQLHWANATDDARSNNAIVQNNSWGTTNLQIDTLLNHQANNGLTDGASYAALVGGTASDWDTYATALNNFQSNGVIVRAAGNDSSKSEVGSIAGMPLAYFELEEAWLTVGNLVVNGSDATSSTVTRLGNKCGRAAKFCIFADGYRLTSGIGGYNGSMYYSYSGSSMAAPIVSGGIALLSEAFPNHTPEQLVDRVLATADNSFFSTTDTLTFTNGITHGYNSEFGQGILDLEKALSPITSSMVSNGILLDADGSNNIEGAKRFDIGSSRMRLGSAFGDAFSTTLKGRKAYFYDALNGGFAFDLGTLVSDKSSKAFGNPSFDKVSGANQLLHSKAANGMSFISRPVSDGSDDKKMMAFIPISNTTTSFVGNGMHLQNALSFSQRPDERVATVTSESPFSIPFVSASENGNSAGTLLEAGSGALSFAVFNGTSNDYGLATNGFVSEYGNEIGSSYVSTFVGFTNETDGFLETSVEGAFAENAKADTTYAGVSSQGRLGNKWSYNALASVGSTHMKVDGLGMLRDIRDVTSTSFALEFARPFGGLDSDSINIGISQPLRVEQGKASISVPGLYEKGGKLQYSPADVGLAPSGRQIDLNLGYKSNIYDHIDVGIHMAISQDYGHLKSDKFTGSTAAFLKVNF